MAEKLKQPLTIQEKVALAAQNVDAAYIRRDDESEKQRGARLGAALLHLQALNRELRESEPAPAEAAVPMLTAERTTAEQLTDAMNRQQQAWAKSHQMVPVPHVNVRAIPSDIKDAIDRREAAVELEAANQALSQAATLHAAQNAAASTNGES